MGQEKQEQRETTSALRGWLMLNGASVVLIAAGLLFVAAGVWVVDERQTVATALVLFGAGMVIIGALLPRIEGVVTFSLREGLKFTLAAERAAERKAAERQLSPEKTEQVVGMAIEQAVAQAIRPLKTRRVSHGTDALIAPPTAEAIAEAAVEHVIDLDAAREERRREGQDVENEPRLEEVQRKLDSGEPLTSTEQAAIDRLVEAMTHLMDGAKSFTASGKEGKTDAPGQSERPE